jgi:hypothetical protein
MFSLAKILKQIQKYAKTNEEALAAVRKNIAKRNKENPQSGPKYKFDKPKAGTSVTKRGGTEVVKRSSNAVTKRNSNAVTVPGGKGASQNVKVDNIFTGLKMATLEDLTSRVNEYLKDGTPNTAAGVKTEIKKTKGLSKADATKLISILGPEIKEAAAKKRSDSFKPAPAGPRPKKELTFGEKFKQERAKAKKAGKELTATFTYKGKSYHTRTEKEEDTRKEKASARISGRGSRAVTIMDIKDKTKPKTKKANRGALVSRQRKGHTDMRKGGLFR